MFLYFMQGKYTATILDNEQNCVKERIVWDDYLWINVIFVCVCNGWGIDSIVFLGSIIILDER